MRIMLFAALAAATFLSGEIFATHAAAMTAAPSLPDAATANTPPIAYVANVCGNNGCAPVQTKRVQHYKPPQQHR